MKLVVLCVLIFVSLSAHAQYALTENMQECICMARSSEAENQPIRISSDLYCEIAFHPNGTISTITIDDKDGTLAKSEYIYWDYSGSISASFISLHAYEFFASGRLKTHILYDNSEEIVFHEFYKEDEKGRHFLSAKIYGEDCVGKGCKEHGF